MRQISRILMAAVLFSGAGVASAAPVQVVSGGAVFEYDLDNFFLSVDGVTYDSSVYTVTPVANGIRLGFSGNLNIYASSYFTYSPVSRTADYSAVFSLAPTAGNTITGFSIVYAGGYSVETPGYAGAGGVGLFVDGSSGGGPFSITSNFTGSGIPTLTGQLSATGDVGFVEVFDRYEEVFVGYQQVLDYCDQENPEICYYHDEPVYQLVAVYKQEMDLGEASIYIDSITILANVEPVPVPPSGLLLASGLLGLGVRKMRQRKAVVIQQ